MLSILLRRFELHLKRRKKCLLTIAVCLATSTATTAIAQPLIEEQQRLNFGILAIASNASVSRFNYPRTGRNINVGGQFALISSGSPGLYRFTGFPAFTPLDVSLNNTTLTPLGGGFFEPLDVDNYDFAELTTNAQGEAELALGARLSTTGNGSNYVDAEYLTTTVLRVDYWQPDERAFVFNTLSIDLEAELRSTLTINQEQQLNFGTLFAQSSNTSQAVLSLSTSGNYTINEQGDSRLVSLSRPEQGILRVSGAAPNYNLTITPQSTDVFLRHSENPNSAPYFILSDLVTSPDGSVMTNANGELVIKIGGTLKTELTPSSVIYPSGQYEGTYDVTVVY